MSKLIIFGASGFIGQALIQPLERDGVEYVAHSSKTLDLVSSDAPENIADITNDGDAIVMLSALTPEKGEAGDLTIRNITMVNNLLEGIKHCSIEHLIYVSSDAVYSLESDIIDEETPPQPHDLYGCMHVMREQFLQSDIEPEKLTIFRPCSIYGKGDTHNGYSINRFIRSATERGEIELFGEGEEYRDHLYIDDFVNIIVAACQQRIAGTFNVASGKSWRFAELAEYIKSCLDREVAIVHKPRGVPISHRHVDMSKLWATFPACKPRAVEAGIKQFLKTLQDDSNDR